MRGSLALVALVLALFVTGSAAAALGPGGEPDAATREIRWFVPPVGYVDHPVFAAVGVYENDQLVRDQTLRLTVMSGDGADPDVLFFSQHIHESDGFHTLALTPREAGHLTLRADFTHTAGAAEATARIPIDVSPVSSRVPYEPFHVAPRFEDDLDEGHMALWGEHHGIEHMAWLDVHAADGRLLTSHVAGAGHVSHLVAPIGGFGDGQAHALVTSHTASNVTIFTETLSQDVDRTHQPMIRQPQIVTNHDTCEAAGVAVTTDPASVTPEGLTWHTDTDVRVAIATDRHLDGAFRPTESGRMAPTSALYHVSGHDPTAAHTGTEGDSMLAMPADPFRELVFRVRDPGLYAMTAHDGAFPAEWSGCTLYFSIVPNPVDATGTVRHEVTVRDDEVTIALRAERDGDPLSGYTFDTRVIKHHTADEPGRLVWKGKLHGVEGKVGFALGALEPGDYEMRTYPSPERLGTAPVAAPTEDGFVHRFTITAPEPEPVITKVPPEPEAIPAVGPLMALALLVALAVRLRRR